jgi:Uncharacterized protein conserved in bacteria (DUF2252)
MLKVPDAVRLCCFAGNSTVRIACGARLLQDRPTSASGSAATQQGVRSSGQADLIAGYCGKSDAVPDALGSFAICYADQTDADHDRLLTAIRSGTVSATMGL